MIIEKAFIHYLNIPFKMTFSHSKADRAHSDSIILEIQAKSASGKEIFGYGEAVIREYVSGTIENSDTEEEAVTSVFNEFLNEFRSRELSPDNVLNELKAFNPEAEKLPVLCAVETAMLDLLCTETGSDIYNLLGVEPQRETIVYGGTLPVLPIPAARKLMGAYKQMQIPNLRIKVLDDTAYNTEILALGREIFGDDYPLKIDANAAWTAETAVENFPLLKKFGITIIEEPFGRNESEMDKIKKHEAFDDFIFMADESALNMEDLKAAVKNKTYKMINIRLAKNGGLLKALDLAAFSDKNGMKYMSGCHVGETGVLSAAGRAAASIMKNPVFTDGSFDAHLLEGNVTEDDLSFGLGGIAGIIRNKNLGFKLSRKNLEGYTIEKRTCF